MSEEKTVKFMQVLNKRIWKQLEEEAYKKGIGVQELIRMIIPLWLKKEKDRQRASERTSGNTAKND